MIRSLSAALASTLLVGCTSLCKTETKPVSEQNVVSLSKKYQDHFLIGATADIGSYITHRKLLDKHFNSLTTENEMKFEELQPEEGVFTFEVADAMLEYARSNNMATRGHALVWHRQTPQWVFEDENGNQASKALLLQRMKTHIGTVMTHFKGKVDAWDVVNEAVVDDGSLRTNQEERDDQKSPWYGILGEDYIAEAFRMAREADPDSKLFYNDYYNYLPARTDAIYKLLKGLIDKGVPIDGVGLQCHLNVTRSSDPEHQSHYQTIENLEKAIQRYASLGLEVHITELDLSVYVGGYPYKDHDYYIPSTFDSVLQAKQAERYREIFEMFRRNSDIISSVTFWGIADDNTWLSEFDSGRQDFPLLFDLFHKPKPSFFSITDF